MTYGLPSESEQPKRRGVVVALVLTAVLVVLALGGQWLGLFGGGSGASAAAGGAAAARGQMPPMPVDVDTARQSRVVDAVRVTGRIEAEQAVELRPDEQGRVTAILFTEGQSVSAGVPLVRIDDALLRAQAERATADRDLANQQLA